jgi:hypothetical protein
MTITANAATTTAHTIAYSAQSLTGAAATASTAAGAYTVLSNSGGRTVELRISVDRRNAQTHSLPTSVPSAVDPLSSRTSSSTLAVAASSNRVKRPVASQWDV